MVQVIEVTSHPGMADSGKTIRDQIEDYLGLSLEDVKVVRRVSIDREMDPDKLDFLARELFADPIVEEYRCGGSLAGELGFDQMVEVGFKPGQTDNEARRAVSTIELLTGEKFGEGEDVYISRQYLLKGKLGRQDAERIAKEVLANGLVQAWQVTGCEEYSGRDSFPLPKMVIPHEPRIGTISLDVPDPELLGISKERKLALSLEEMEAIQKYFSRPEVREARRGVGLGDPTDAELESLAQTWSEHCKHKIFNARIRYRENGVEWEIDGLFPTFIKGPTEKLKEELDWVVSTLWDNAGVMQFNKDWLFAFKGETHNSPSAKEPYGGSLTGIVGVYRDPMGTGRGAHLIYGAYGFCTANPFYRGELEPELHPRRLQNGVVSGVRDGGNKHGVPTPYGRVFIHDGYMGKPAIYVLAAGMIPAEVNGVEGWKKWVNPGDAVVMAGGRVGIDGIHGATESCMDGGEGISTEHVQMGDPFTQKKMHDFLLEARDQGLYNAITDNGAGGLNSSVGEMARFSGGVVMDLSKVPLKYKGLDPWQILLSESQERMTLAVPPEKLGELKGLAEKHEVEVSEIGGFTDSGIFQVLYGKEQVAYLGMDFLHEGVPRLQLEAGWIPPEERGLREPEPVGVENHGAFLKEMLARPNIASHEWIQRQYDHEVQGTSVIKPLVGKGRDMFSDAAVVKPLYSSWEGIAISAGLNPDYGEIDTYHMAALALDEAIRRVIAVGGTLEQIALNDNFCWPSPLPGESNPDAAYKLGQLVRANQALADYSLAFKTPCISGKDSMSLDGTVRDKGGKKHRISAPPTLQFSAAGKIEDVRKCVTMDFKAPGDVVYVLGKTRDELGGSEFYRLHGEAGLNVPQVDAGRNAALYRALSGAIEKRLVRSVHGCYKGGLVVALAQSAFAGGLGADVFLGSVPSEGELEDGVMLYSESAGRFLVSVSPHKLEEFEEAVGGNSYRNVGIVQKQGMLSVYGRLGELIIREDIQELKHSWKSPCGGF